MKRITLSILICTLLATWVQAQVTIGSLSDPAKAALLDLKTQEPDGNNVTSQKGGILLPRVQLQKLNSLMPFIADAELAVEGPKHIGLSVYNIIPLPAENIVQGTYTWNGSQWEIEATTASNGLTKSNGNIKLGGDLTGKTAFTTDTDTITFESDNAILQLDSEDKGFVPPRIALKGLNDNVTVPNPLNGTIIYHTDNNVMPEGLHVWDSGTASWKSIVMEIPETPSTEANIRTNTVAGTVLGRGTNLLDMDNINEIPFGDIIIPENGSYAFMLRIAGQTDKANGGWNNASPKSMPIYLHLKKNNDFVDKQAYYAPYWGDQDSSGGTLILVAPNCKKGDSIKVFGGINYNTSATLSLYSTYPSPTTVAFWKL